MRFGMMGVAAAALMSAMPAHAATIVQTNASADKTFFGFDPARGTLTSVTLDLIAGISRVFTLTAPSTTTTLPFSYTTTGVVTVNTPAGTLSINVSGQGSSTVSLSPVQGTSDASGNGQTFATGSASFSLDPSAFIGRGAFSLDGVDPLYGTFGIPAGTTISAPGATSIMQAYPIGRLGTGVSPTLTYTYTPAVATGAVPEPATWALMIAGFGLMGVGLRRRERNALAHA